MIIRESWRQHQPEKDQQHIWLNVGHQTGGQGHFKSPQPQLVETQPIIVYSTGWACYDEQCL